MPSAPTPPNALAASLAFFLPAWRAAWGALTLAVLACILAVAVRAGLVRAAWAGPAVIAAGLVARGALWRLALGRGRPGPAGLQLGAVEARLMIADILGLIFLLVLGSLFFVVVLAVAFAAASSGRGFVVSQIATWAPAVDARGQVVVTVVTLLGAAGMLWAALRISLAEAATVAEGRIKVLSTWPLTRGRAGSILFSCLVLLAPALLAPLAVWLGAGSSTAAWAAAVGAGAWLGGAWLPMSVGLMTYFHDHRAPLPRP